MLRKRRIDALREQHGCDVRVVAADVADPHDVARLLATVQAELPPLAGIVHAAGEIGTTPLSTLDDAEVDRVFAGKVWGAWHLSEASRRPAAGLLPVHLLDRLGMGQLRSDRLRRGQRLPRRAGLAAARAGRPRDQRQLRPVVGGHGRRRRLAHATGSARHPDAVARRRAGRYGRRHGGRRCTRTGTSSGGPDRLGPLPAALPAGRPAGIPGRAGARGARIGVGESSAGRRRAPPGWSSSSPPLRCSSARNSLIDYLRDTVAEVTRIDAAEIREEAGFFDLGMDSLMAVELRRRLEQAVGKELPATLAMDFPGCPTWRTTCWATCSASANRPAPTRGPADFAGDLGARTSRSPSSRWPAGSPARPIPRRSGSVLSGGVDAIREIPEDRFDIDEFYDPDPADAGQDLHPLRRIPRQRSTDSIRSSSASLRARPSGSIRSSA